MSTSGGSSASERDLRLDFFRGIALFSIFIDHVAWNNLLAQFTLQSVGFSDAAEVFILISGYTAGMVYGRAIERQGLLMAAMRIYHRVWQLYVAHVFLFMQFVATAAYPGPDHVWFFNPFCWQALFFLGAWCGWRGIRGGMPWLTHHGLFRLAAA